MNTFKKVFLALMVVLASLCVACGLGGVTPEQALANIKLETTKDVVADFTLPTEVEGFKGTITWTSDDEELVKIEGNVAKVTRPEYTNGTPIGVTLTATAEAHGVTASKNFPITVAQLAKKLAAEFAETYTVDVLGSAKTADFVLPTTDTYNEKAVTISWESNSEFIVIEGGKAKVTRPASDAAENATVKLTATITIDGDSAKKEFTITVLKQIYQQLGDPIKVAPTPGTPYKWGMVQTSKGAVYYFTGEMNGFYGATTTEAALGVDVYVEATEGGFYVYFKNAKGEKQYVNGEVSGTHKNFVFGATAKSVWTWNETCNSLVTTVGEATCFPGTYDNYYTFGMCDMAKWDASSNYAGQFYVNDGSLPVPTIPEIYPVMGQPEAGKEYLLGIRQAGLVKLLYFTGKMDGYYGGTTVDKAAAVKVVAEATEGGYNLAYTIDGAKKYITVVKSDTHINFTLGEAGTPWTWNAGLETFETLVDGTAYFLGTSGTYNTVSANKVSAASGKYIAQFYAVDAAEITDADRIARAENELKKLEASYSGKDNLDLAGLSDLFGTTITWTSSDATVMTNEGVITPGSEDKQVTLTAVIALEGQESKTVTLTLTVKEVSATSVKDVVKAAIAGNGEEVLVKFVAKVIGFTSGKNGTAPVFADNTAAIYSYSYTTAYKIEGLKVGDVVETIVKVKTYNSCVEIVSVISAKLVETEVNAVAPTKVEASAFTSLSGKDNAAIFADPIHNKLIIATGELVKDGSYYNVMIGESKLSLKGADATVADALNGKKVTVIGLLTDANATVGYWNLYFYGAENQLVECVEQEGGETPEQPEQPTLGAGASFDFGTADQTGYASEKELTIKETVSGTDVTIIGHYAQITKSDYAPHSKDNRFAVLCPVRKENNSKASYIQFALTNAMSKVTFDATWWSASDSNNASKIVKFEVQYSADGTTWTSVDFGGLNAINATEYKTLSVDLVDAKYVRIYCEGDQVYTSNQSCRLAIDNVKFE